MKSCSLLGTDHTLESGECYYANAFDKAGKLWQLSKVWTDDPQYQEGGAKFKAEPTPAGTRMSAFQSINVIDVQNSRRKLPVLARERVQAAPCGLFFWAVSCTWRGCGPSSHRLPVLLAAPAGRRLESRP